MALVMEEMMVYEEEGMQMTSGSPEVVMQQFKRAKDKGPAMKSAVMPVGYETNNNQQTSNSLLQEPNLVASMDNSLE